MDAAFRPGAYPGYTISELREFLRRPTSFVTEETAIKITREIERREAVAAGNVSAMTPAERLRCARAE